MKIHPTAIVHPKAELDEEVEIGPFTIVEENVAIGKGTKLDSHVVLKKYTKIGQNCIIYPGAVIGGIPQIKNYEERESYVIIGDNNIIREYVTIHRGWKEKEATLIGNDNFIMANAHIAHNCRIGSNVILTNFATLAGHVEVNDQAFISGLTGIHQFVRIGTLSMVSGISKVVQDAPPYMLVDGHPAVVYSLNNVGLKRAGFSQEARNNLKAAYRLLYRCGLNTSQALKKIEAESPDSPEIAHLLNFIRHSERGICQGKKGREIENEGAYDSDSRL